LGSPGRLALEVWVKCMGSEPRRMAAQEETRQADGRRREDPEAERYLQRQREIFRERREELLARHPGMAIAVCGGDVFADRDSGKAVARADEAHPDRLIYLYMPDTFCLAS